MTLIQTTERNRQMDFTNPILIGKSRMMLRYPEEESRLTAIFRPFSALVTHGFLMEIYRIFNSLKIHVFIVCIFLADLGDYLCYHIEFNADHSCS